MGRSIESSGLRGLPGLFLISIERHDGTTITAVSSEGACPTPPPCAHACRGVLTREVEVLQVDDVLWFAGERSAVSTLRRIPGLEETDDTQVHKLKVRLLDRR